MEARLNISRYRVDDLVARKVPGRYLLVQASCSRKDKSPTFNTIAHRTLLQNPFFAFLWRAAITAAKRQKGCTPTKLALKPFGPADGGSDTARLISSFF